MLNLEISLKEILYQMEQVQSKNRTFDPSKKVYYNYRQIIVDWMCEKGEQFKISLLAAHHAVAILDQYFSLQPDLVKNE